VANHSTIFHILNSKVVILIEFKKQKSIAELCNIYTRKLMDKWSDRNVKHIIVICELDRIQNKYCL